jgi:hypothetical protein
MTHSVWESFEHVSGMAKKFGDNRKTGLGFTKCNITIILPFVFMGIKLGLKKEKKTDDV